MRVSAVLGRTGSLTSNPLKSLTCLQCYTMHVCASMYLNVSFSNSTPSFCSQCTACIYHMPVADTCVFCKVLTTRGSVQEFCNGGSVRSLLSKGAFAQQAMAHTWATIMHAAKGIAGGMQYVHGKRICHGDLNPSNILLKVCLRTSPAARPMLFESVHWGLCRCSIPLLTAAVLSCFGDNCFQSCCGDLCSPRKQNDMHRASTS